MKNLNKTNNNGNRLINRENKTKFNTQENSPLSKEDYALFQTIGKTIIEQERIFASKTLIPNYHNFGKYLFVKKQLNKIAKSHNTSIYQSPNNIHAYFTIKLYTLDTDDFRIINKISKYCSAIGIDAELNGKLTLCFTVPDTYLAI